MSRRFHVCVVLLCAGLLGCPGPAEVIDAGSGTDSGPGPTDTGGPSDTGAAPDAFSAGDAPVVDPVVRCQALAATFATNCTGIDAVRVCTWGAYGSLCETGDTARLVAAMECLDATQCRIFSDPNDGLACLEALPVSAAQLAYMSGVSDRCGGGPLTTNPGSAGEIVPFLTDAQVSALDACDGTACGLDAIIGACTSALPEFAACGG